MIFSWRNRRDKNINKRKKKSKRGQRRLRLKRQKLANRFGCT